MATNQDYVEYIKTLVRQDSAANDRIEEKLDREGWGDGFPRFLASLFFLAIDRRFGTRLDRSEIIRFVGEMRAGLSSGGPDLDPHAAEALIESTIDPSVDYDMDQEMIGKIQGATIYKVLRESNLTEDDLDGLLEEAGRLSTRTA